MLEPKLLVLDDLFLARRISDGAAELLQTVVHQRYKLRKSILVTSNSIVEDWGKYFDLYDSKLPFYASSSRQIRFRRDQLGCQTT